MTLTLTDADCTREPYKEIWHRPSMTIDDANDWAILHTRMYNSIFDNPVKLLFVEIEVIAPGR